MRFSKKEAGITRGIPAPATLDIRLIFDNQYRAAFYRLCRFSTSTETGVNQGCWQIMPLIIS